MIRRICTENVLWGAPRIQSELALLGHDVGQSTVDKYMVKRKDREPSQGWRTFLANQMTVSAACDFFTVPTLSFTLLCVFGRDSPARDEASVGRADLQLG